MDIDPFHAVYRQGEPGAGIGGYDLKSPSDRSFALDYNSSGKLDHLVIYRPGTGTCWILSNQRGSFTPVYGNDDSGTGFGGFDLKHPNDRGFAFDYNSTGNQDHVVFYRPGFGAIFIMKYNGERYTPVYAQGHNGSGIGGFDLKSDRDRVFAFDYNHSGCADHLVLYRPGTGTIWILKNNNGDWSPVYQQGDPGHGIGGFDLKSPADRAFAFDWESNGKLDHIALYRPGRGTFWILQNRGGLFSSVIHIGDPGPGIGGFDLANPFDEIIAYDWEHTGKDNHIAIYRPGTGTFWVLKRNQHGGFRAVFREGDPGNGIGGYDLKSREDKFLAFDYESSGRKDYLIAYRTNGSGTIWILKHL